MYAVIRTGGKQYRVTPGDILRVETQPNENGRVQFGDVLAVSGGDGQIARPDSDALVTGEVLGEGRGKKVIVFHYKRKQYKKLQGHRQAFTSVRITEIAFDGQKFTAPELPKKQAKPKKAAAESEATPKAETKAAKPAAKKKAAAPKKSAAKKTTGKKK